MYLHCSIEVTEDTKLPNAATIKVLKQDHTLANLLRAQLLANPHVLFAGYKLPHPLQPFFLIKLQTDGTITPVAALDAAAARLIATLASLEAKFKREFSFRDVAGATAAAAAGGATSTTGTGATGTGAPGDDPYAPGGGTGASGWSSGRDYMDF